MDLDILLYNNDIIDTTELKIPHPEMHKRRFVLKPLSDIAPDAVHTVLKKTIVALLESLTEKAAINKIKGIVDGKYIVIEAQSALARQALQHYYQKELNARLILEKAEENPFLTSFYKDHQRHAFQTQIFFLMCKCKRQELAQQDLFKRTTISDYLFDKDRIFAYLNLNENELALIRADF